MDSRNGKKLWEFMTDAGVNAPPTIYEHNGKQYIAVTAAMGARGVSPRTVPSVVAPDIRHPSSGNALYVFSLGD